MSAAPKDLDDYAAGTRTLVLGIGDAVAQLDRRMRAFERIFGLTAQALGESGPEDAPDTPPERPSLTLVPRPARVRTSPPRRPPLYPVPAKEA
jgi:hypothetical protein